MCDRCAELEEEVAYWKGEAGAMRDQDLLAALRRKSGLTGRQAQLLEALWRRRGRPTRRERLLEMIEDDDRGLTLVSVIASQVRQKLGRDAILTEFGLGYVIGPSGLAAVEAARAV
jgi:DNA-binding response OmpR family regulator